MRSCFKEKTCFIPFLMSGYPSLACSTQAVLAAAKAGADMIELGVPFSDPIADGPTNQEAAHVALQQGVTLKKTLEQVKSIRQQQCQTPIVLFTYFNPILQMGCIPFCQKAKEVGVSGVLVVDLPSEEGLSFYTTCQHYALGFALLASPTTSAQRLSNYQRLNPDFIYYISRCGVTGAQTTLPKSLASEINYLKRKSHPIPIAVGFGISNLEQAQSVALHADGVIVGSHLINTLKNNGLHLFEKESRLFAEAVHHAC